MFGYNRGFSLLLTLFLLSFYATLYNIIFRLKRGGLQILTLIRSHAFENKYDMSIFLQQFETINIESSCFNIRDISIYKYLVTIKRK